MIDGISLPASIPMPPKKLQFRLECSVGCSVPLGCYFCLPLALFYLHIFSFFGDLAMIRHRFAFFLAVFECMGKNCVVCLFVAMPLLLLLLLYLVCLAIN